MDRGKVEIKVLGICGSPIKGGNAEVFLVEALKAAQEYSEVTTEMIPLAGKNIEDCRHCNWCLTKQEEDKFCAIKDDMTEIYPKVLGADALLLATPVYFTRLSGRLANFIDRLRCFIHGNYYQGGLPNKIGGAMAVAWWRNAGLETTLTSITFAFFGLNMMVVTPGYGSPFGAAGLSSEGGTGKFAPEDKLGVLRDEYGVRSAQALGRRVAEIARIMKAGQQAIAKL